MHPSDAIAEHTELRRALHAHPELARAERDTAARIVAALRDCRPTQVLEHVGGHGIVAVFDGAVPGPVVLLRAELDALPIGETGERPWRSRRDGLSHSCGHDGHMATLIALARDLSQRPPRTGSVYLLFQPAEETGEGAAAVIDDARFRSLPRPDAVYAWHNIPKYPLGHVLLRAGLFAQASAGFLARFTGSTSHASYPEHGRSPARAVTGLVDAVNGIADGFDGAGPVLGTVTFARLGAEAAGVNFGTAPGEAVVSGVLRAEATADLDRLCDTVAAHARRLAAADALDCDVSWHERFAATVSAPAHVEIVARAAATAGLPVQRLAAPFRWSEDFGYLTEAFDGAFFGIGSGAAQPQLHDSGYDFPDGLIAPAARVLRAIVDAHAG